MKTQWFIEATRTVNGWHYATYTLGPFKSRFTAKLTAWFETFGEKGKQAWMQTCVIYRGPKT